MSTHPLVTRDGIEAFMTVLALQTTWRSLTLVQKNTLLQPDTAVAEGVHPVTVRHLTGKGLWDADGITDLGRAVVRFRPGNTDV